MRVGEKLDQLVGELLSNFPNLRSSIIELPRRMKAAVVSASDFFCLSLALWLALSVRFNDLYWPPSIELALVLAVCPLLGVGAMRLLGAYRHVTRHMGVDVSLRIVLGVTLSILAWGTLVFITGIGTPALPYGIIPRSSPAAYLVTGLAFLFASRAVAAYLLHGEVLTSGELRSRKGLLIYGAGPAGVQVKEAIARTGSGRIAAFLDDDPGLWGRYVGGTKVYKPEPANVERIIRRDRIEEIILAVPHLPRSEQKAILAKLQAFPIRVKILPSLDQLAAGRVAVSDIRPVQVEDLLGRDAVPADHRLLTQCIADRSVMITGAGGSIGSELVRQIARLGPKRIVLFELSEFALYQINTELADQLSSLSHQRALQLETVLGSVLDGPLLERTMRENAVQVVFHAAAYKHVPIVEANLAAGIRNNTFGTETAVLAARAAGVERFVLISTDKAVRPTNVMGASKRLAELVLQAHAAEGTCGTVFTMVRFGNVLDSSGSVVHRFRKQIDAGGPITVTHRDVTRYFMSIPEAAELVLQAGAMASGGDVFLLDMGQPVKIDDLARTMVRLAGLEVRDGKTSMGDIEITYTGLRPGEKLYEELLIGPGAESTQHPRILKHHEPHLPLPELQSRLERLRQALDSNDEHKVQALLRSTVEGYAPSPPSSWTILRPHASRALH